jgi:poly(hydroxyalkanoate) depolymerase family esterase
MPAGFDIESACMAENDPSLPARIAARLQRARDALLTRLGLRRGRWHRGQTTLATIRLLPGLGGHRTWRYGLFVPAGMRDDEAAPLIVLLHGCHQRALRFGEATGWAAYADQARVRLLCPDQRRLSNLLRCWNWFDPRAQRGQGELSVVLAMIEQISGAIAIAPGAVGVVGLSAGGALAALLGFHYPERFRAVVAVAAPPLLGAYGHQTPRQVMLNGLARDPGTALGTDARACAPMLVIHGSADAVVNPRCADQLTEQAVESWRRAHAQIDRATQEEDSGRIRVTEYRAGERLVVRQIEYAGLGHTWTGGPGGHPYCERGGPDLTGACAQFLKDCGFSRA